MFGTFYAETGVTVDAKPEMKGHMRLEASIVKHTLFMKESTQPQL